VIEFLKIEAYDKETHIFFIVLYAGRKEEQR
jgi:hypothetical protein